MAVPLPIEMNEFIDWGSNEGSTKTTEDGLQALRWARYCCVAVENRRPVLHEDRKY